jgi:hypothetical protein
MVLANEIAVTYYRIIMLVWPVRLARWVLLYFVYSAAGLYTALAFVAVPFGFQMVVPIPHRQFIPLFRRALSKNVEVADGLTTIELMQALRNAEELLSSEQS